jgi:hypothetical protein
MGPAELNAARAECGANATPLARSDMESVASHANVCGRTEVALSFLASLLRPTGAEIHTLVSREMDPAHATEFEPICRGPLIGLLGLAAIGIACVVSLPIRLFRRILPGR